MTVRMVPSTGFAEAGIGRHRGLGQGLGDIGPVDDIFVVASPARPRQYPGEDDAGVTASPHQSPVAMAWATWQRWVGRRIGLLERRAHGEEHIGTGIPIGHRKNVQGIVSEASLLQPGSAAANISRKSCPVIVFDCFITAPNPFQVTLVSGLLVKWQGIVVA